MLNDDQIAAFRAVLHHGATEASEALHRWVNKPSRISLDAVEQLPLQSATTVLGDAAEPICFCVVEMTGLLTGQLILAFDDASGLALADTLLDRSTGSTIDWGEMERSAVLETTNIVCCAYLNAVARVIPVASDDPPDLIPTPPRFSRDYPESLLEFALMGQIIETDHALLARTQFEIDGSPVDWTLLFVPDAASMARLCEVLR
jgi:chemotaxis protein CheC